ncbi:MAG: hypothetical protein ACRDS9_17175, partial [Pseudonocardiaceae bacterium]
MARLQASDPLGLANQLNAEMRAFTHRCGLALADIYTEQPDVSSRVWGSRSRPVALSRGFAARSYSLIKTLSTG